MHKNHTALAALILCTALSAQNAKVVPTFCTGVDGNDQSYFPFLYDMTMVQQLWDGAAVCNAIALISDVKFRRDAIDPTPLPGYSIGNLIVRLGHSSLAPATMSTNFANNRTSPLTQIFAGPYSPPAQPPPTGAIGTFNVGWPISTPFFYQRVNGNLLLEFEIPGLANNKRMYTVDAVRTNPNGLASKYGTSGVFASREALALDCPSQPGQLVPGGTAIFAVSGLKSAYPTILVLGGSRTWDPTLNMVLPIDMTPLNAPGNSLYISPDLNAGALPLVQQGATWGGSVSLPIPNLAWLGAQMVFGQLMSIDPPSNGLGIVLSNGMQLVLGTPSHFTQTLGASDSTATQGFFMFGGAGDAGGPVVQFGGTIG